jgi:Zn-dependent alcohol dehydrogenase
MPQGRGRETERRTKHICAIKSDRDSMLANIEDLKVRSHQPSKEGLEMNTEYTQSTNQTKIAVIAALQAPMPVPMPIVLGHEGAGVVERCGSAVTSLAPGDHVVLSYQACGHCRPCLTGHAQYCLRGFDAKFGGARLDGTNGLHRATPADTEIHGHELESIDQAFADSRSGEVIKPILRIGKE